MKFPPLIGHFRPFRKALKPFIWKTYAKPVLLLSNIKESMDIILRTQQLETLFSPDKKTGLADSRLEILPFRFQSSFQGNQISNTSDDSIPENKTFNYYVFAPAGAGKHTKAILLMHGLNERSWKKYLPWAEYLAQTTGTPVILFPLAFHINRTPAQWTNPRLIRPWVDKRNLEIPGLENSTFVNVALSNRLSEKPLRFYTSGLETVSNLHQLSKEIKNGEHPLFKEDTSIHFFSYSIGALISEVLFLANPGNLFTGSRLFMFCGGSVFSRMNANARDIVDSATNDRLQSFYCNDFIKNIASIACHPAFETCKKAFEAMIRPDVLRDYRDQFFREAKDRIRAIALKADTVVPTPGIQSALGKLADKIMEEWDFQYPYSHQWPFPITVNEKTPAGLVNESFEKVFRKAADFL
jgi:hypothetical protein